jgi:coenzyme Q-binding protein COQ10
MSTHAETRVLPYPADLMYAVVSEVEKYPQFLPWVTGLCILARHSDRVFDCEMRVGFAGLSEGYTSRVTLDPVAHSIDVVQLKGPFRFLENHWRFTPQGEVCKVDFAIAFEFRNPLLNRVAGKAFEHVMLQMAGAFEARAKALQQLA